MHQSSKNKINLLQLPKEWRKFYGVRTESFVFITHSLGGCGPLRAGEALGLEIGKHISEDCRTLYIRQKAKRGKIQPI